MIMIRSFQKKTGNVSSIKTLNIFNHFELYINIYCSIKSSRPSLSAEQKMLTIYKVILNQILLFVLLSARSRSHSSDDSPLASVDGKDVSGLDTISHCRAEYLCLLLPVVLVAGRRPLSPSQTLPCPGDGPGRAPPPPHRPAG